MPPPNDKQLTLAYAAGASLAAVTLVYVFGPTWFIDSNSSSRQRRKGVVGLVNTANDCFINSILQALAGLGELRMYLVRRTRTAQANGELIGNSMLDGKPFLTAALKEILDGLNERPIYRKTLSARPFLAVLERVFKQKISRSQQDAHEFLQVVSETLAEEYHKQKKAEGGAKTTEAEPGSGPLVQNINDNAEDKHEEEDGVIINVEDSDQVGIGKEEHNEEDEGMPLEGKLESEIECQKCHFKPKPTGSTFVVLTLPVPQKSYTSLSDCINDVLSTEYIDDFQCAKCRLEHAISTLSRKIESASSSACEKLRTNIKILEEALETDPEHIPEGIELPPSKSAPKSRIARHTRITSYPNILVIHLSRSIYDAQSSSRKNGAKVAFPEELHMGGIMDRKSYRLLCMVTHKGGHDSGHYECFRRQIVHRAPYSTPILTPAVSSPPTPDLPSTPIEGSTIRLVNPTEYTSSLLPPDTAASNSPTVASSTASSISNSDSRSIPSSSISANPNRPNSSPSLAPDVVADTASQKKTQINKVRKKHGNNKWWRISDEKIKETRTPDVLGMQKEVYLLFYEKQSSEM